MSEISIRCSDFRLLLFCDFGFLRAGSRIASGQRGGQICQGGWPVTLVTTPATLGGAIVQLTPNF